MSQQTTWASKKEALVARLLAKGGVVTWEDSSRNPLNHRDQGWCSRTWVFDPRVGFQLVEFAGCQGDGTPYSSISDENHLIPYGKEVVELYFSAHVCHNHVDNVSHWGIRLSVPITGARGWGKPGAEDWEVFLSKEEFEEIFCLLRGRALRQWLLVMGL